MSMQEELAALGQMTTGELAARYAELHGQPVRTRHRAYLVRKVAWRLQALAEGDLSERARRRAEELANDADVRVMPPRTVEVPEPTAGSACVTLPVSRDPRIPPPGTAIVKHYKGRTIQVLVHAKGFEYDGQLYKSLSAVAKAATGIHRNGLTFFGLGARHESLA